MFKERDPHTQRAGPSAGLGPQLKEGMVDYVIRAFYGDIWQVRAILGPCADLQECMASMVLIVRS